MVRLEGLGTYLEEHMFTDTHFTHNFTAHHTTPHTSDVHTYTHQLSHHKHYFATHVLAAEVYNDTHTLITTPPNHTEPHFAAPHHTTRLLLQAPKWYTCIQSLFKYHTSFTHTLASLLMRDTTCVFIGVQPKHSYGTALSWVRTITSQVYDSIVHHHTAGRHDAALQCVARMVFLPRLQRSHLRSLLVSSDVVLDTFPFGGGVTTLQALCVDVPVLTLEGREWRGRLTAAMYTIMDEGGRGPLTAGTPTGGGSGGGGGGGVRDALVARDVEEFVVMALRIGGDVGVQVALRRAVREGRGALFEDVRPVCDWLRFIGGVVAPDGGGGGGGG